MNEDIPTVFTCDRCDYRKARNVDYFAKRMCELCANYTEGDDATR